MADNKGKKENKKHVGFWLDPGTDSEIDRGTELDRSGSRSAFVENAVDHYIRSLEGEKPDAEKAIAALRGFERHMASILFKIAGELATIELIMNACLVDVSEEHIRWYRNSAYNIVRKRGGMISFSEARDEAEKLLEDPYSDDDPDGGYRS